MFFDVLNSALSSMTTGPKSLSRALAFAAEDETGEPIEINSEALLKYLLAVGPGDEAISVLRRRLAQWDNDDGLWADTTLQNTHDRRALIYRKLALDAEWQAFCETRLPFQPLARPTIIAQKHTRWYTPDIRKGRDFYWTRYSDQLLKQGWPEVSVLQLDDSTTNVLERLADPTSDEAYQSKGLVIGYVQSGKTANFTGVLAKAADAGYKLIIVLGGLLDVLRSQTQRRIDKELIGRELLSREYVNDPDYNDFVSHGAKPSELGAFDWSRLTGPEHDYQKLAYGVEALKFERRDQAYPFYHPNNLFSSNARIAVVKKNSKVLSKLIADLAALQRQGIGEPLDQIPALIIDDESDQASINVKKPVGPDEVQERTATNKAIVTLLKMLPRAQYIGYTATPFANVFVDPDSEEDIFPKDFLVSLPRPIGYMGVSDFYDFDFGHDENGPNKTDFVRSVVNDDDNPNNLQKAIDSFILSGAIKLWRSKKDQTLRFRHHTMLVHMSQSVQEHKAAAIKVRKMYATGGYDGGKGIDRLVELFKTDFVPVSKRRKETLPFPERFEDLQECLGECLEAIGESADAVRIINNEHKDETPDFDKQSIWKILVGGTKLSRGYTVEGLTVSYYRRRAGAGDTLMQMGRWFGFRRGYGDLVRLFIGTAEKVGQGKQTIDLYEAFGGVCRDEEIFRAQLKKYSSMEDPRITPGQIPPLVPQHMLRPTAANKMRNAVVDYRNFGGELAESTIAPTDSAAIEHNNKILATMVHGQIATQRTLRALTRSGLRELRVMTIPVKTQELMHFLNAYRWYDPKSRDARAGNPLALQIEFLKGDAGDHEIDDWIVLGPKIDGARGSHRLAGKDFDVVYRSRRDDNRYNTYNDPVHRSFAEHICGQATLPSANDALNELRSVHRGVIIYYPITEEEKPKGAKSVKPAIPPFTVGFTLLFPKNNIHKTLSFSVRKKGQPDEAIISLDD
ncbi:Z1 domain-containing protein [Phyllobacterium lublinensis]|uniref:Z1 domain-containing protein n=1 Tax=Phyllobacterium lublinensis TaxID=2875708 RepID=UPI001CD0269D|nr:Z1 domain-containing protein [Phyllobacterium sp. 2063]MBZ9654014.1 Z1 domain-containing protein [Phyllobacterium sp. 2063]